MFKSLLIANRGEIACRIIQTAKKLKIKTIAIYSDIDEQALHVTQADEAYYVGPAESAKSYLNQNNIIKVAKKAKAEAIHPGYGFLSENKEFAEACEENDIIFVGPKPVAIHLMGRKNEAKKIAYQHKVPLLPGYHGAEQDPEFLENEADIVGYPVLIKASSGGGGKGMRKVENKQDFQQALVSAKREALSSFGNDHVIIEKYIENPRHIEVQILSDQHSQIYHFYERDCSLQRRHQKVIEEAPAPLMSDEFREKIGKATIRLARAINYKGAGTVEFIVDPNQKNTPFYFMEMNTRLQVEHPISEKITGFDLVEWQLRVASGEKFNFSQKDIAINGHAIEARLYAENPVKNFQPSTGKIEYLSVPKTDKNFRFDTGIKEGDEITPYYDPMLAKIIVWDKDRKSAIEKLKKVLDKTVIIGIETNRDFLRFVCEQKAFIKGGYSTHFIDQYWEAEKINKWPPQDIIMDVIRYEALEREAERGNIWDQMIGWRLNQNKTFKGRLVHNQKDIFYQVSDLADQFEVSFSGSQTIINKKTKKKREIFKHDNRITIVNDNGNQFSFDVKSLLETKIDTQDSASCFASPMPARVTLINVKEGDKVKKGQSIMALEAMKMEHDIKAPEDGMIKALLFSVGDQVGEGQNLVDFKPIN